MERLRSAIWGVGIFFLTSMGVQGGDTIEFVNGTTPSARFTALSGMGRII